MWGEALKSISQGEEWEAKENKMVVVSEWAKVAVCLNWNIDTLVEDFGWEDDYTLPV